ncbi:MAG: mechanosensitive ion channel, partial [Planctomycetales bacterium]|nr:mechanosensitive ion channel [Planctomycetales bacterium]
AAANPNVLEEPEPVVVFTEFGESCLNFELRLYVSGLLHYRRLKHELNTAIDDAFRERRIEIAFPQRDLHIRSLPPELTEKLSPAAARRADAASQSGN